MNSLTHKRCTKCGETKALSEYFQEKKAKDRHHSQCKKCMSAGVKIWHAANRERDRETARAWRDAHREELRGYFRKYRESHREEINKRSLAWVAENQEQHYNAANKWKRSHPEKTRVYDNNRRARELFNGGKITAKEWKDLEDKYGNRCLRCGATGVKLALDHIIPLSLGGTNSIDNAQPLCKSCNSKKGTKTIDYRPF